MAAPNRFVDHADDTRKTFYARVKNKFKWEWLTEKHPWRFPLIQYQKNRCRGIGFVLFLSKRSELQQ